MKEIKILHQILGIIVLTLMILLTNIPDLTAFNTKRQIVKETNFQ